jgi:hypothetical protein
MYEALFPGVATPITWFAYLEEPGMRCQFNEFIERLPEKRRGKVKAHMIAWAQAGSWVIVNPTIMHRMKDTDPPIYEIKASQERVLFIRCGNDAIAFTGYTKKVNWGKKEQSALDASEKIAVAAANECRSDRT